MFSLTFPAALWGLAAIPVVWLAAWFGRTSFGRPQRILQAAIRSLLVAALALALAGPIWSRPSSRISVVYLVDVSHSIASASLTGAADWIDGMNARVRPAETRVLAFGTRVVRLPNTAALRTLAASATSAAGDAAGRDGSDLESALVEASAEFSPGAAPRVVLMSDGRETRGSVRTAALSLAAHGVPVSVVPLNVRDLGDAWVDGLEAPDVIPAGALVTLTPLIGSQRSTRDATVELRDGAHVVASRIVPLEPGLNPVPLPVTFPTAGPRVLEVVLTMAGDVLAANNRLLQEIDVGARTRALYVEGAPASAQYLQGALEASGFDVTRGDVRSLPATPDAYAPWDVVILSDLARASIADASARALGAWVEQDGGGVFFAGGDAVFGQARDGGAPGYRHSEVERLLPVTLERKDEPDVALLMVLDKSWSMNGPVMEICKSAAQAAVDVLGDDEVVGVLTFDDRFAWDITPRQIGPNRDEIRRKIAAIQPGGDTLIYPALEQAYLMLNKTRAGAKHVVLLSDGRSYPDDYEGLVKKMVDAKITVSSIAVGPEADAELLTNIAKWGRGRGYVVRDAREVPQIFVKEARDAMPAFEEGDAITPVVKAPSFLAHVDLSHLPALNGRTAMVLKDRATELLSTAGGDPLLAFWPVGLGRTAAFASDVNDRWAAQWVTWKGYASFFSTLIRAVARQRPAPLSLEVVGSAVTGSTRTVHVALEARDADGRYVDRLKPAISVRGQGVTPAVAPARQVAPGRYEASITADPNQVLAISLVPSSAGSDGPNRYVVPDPDAEYRFRPTNEGALRAIAAATGGVYAPTSDDLGRPTTVAPVTRHAAWPALAGLALALWLLDIWMRRVRLFEPRGSNAEAA